MIEIWLEKPETVWRVRQRIGAVLDWSFVKGFRNSEAPMRSISNGLPRQPKKTGHFAALPFSDLADFMSKICIRSSLGRLALEFLFLNASRSGNVLGARWSELDLKRNVWTIPADRMKMEREHAVPLSCQALIVLERAKLYRCEAIHEH